MVNNPDQVVATRDTDDMGVLITLKVAKEDMGLVIGKAGAHINALRILARAIGGQNKALINIKLLDEKVSSF